MDALGFFLVVVWPFAAPLLAEHIRDRRRRRRAVSGELEPERVHGVDCGPDGVGLCVRCSGFQPGNDVGRQFEPGHELSKRHGAYSEREIEPLQEAILEQLTRVSPLPSEADDHARRVLAGRLAQIEIARGWVFENGVCDERGELRPIVRELSKWENGARVMLRELGLTTLSRMELGLGLAQTHVAIAEVEPVIAGVYRAAARFVPREHREAFLAEVDGALARLAALPGPGPGDA
jgi:hypothetical protein